MMNEKGIHDFMGEGEFCWFHGIVEDINDPLESGRVRVRCFGIHSPSKELIPTEHLPWALVMMPATSASVSGIGSSPHGFVQGTQVVGFFRDGMKGQHPIIMGSIAGIPQNAPDSSRGFNDPDGEYPRESRINSPDTNQLCGSSHGESAFRIQRTENLITDVTTASGEKWSEPDSEASPKYPKNKVIETEAGHFIEMDDSEGSKRIHIRHSSGSYYEILNDGSVVSRTKGNETRIIDSNGNMLISGSMNVNVNNTGNVKVQDNVTVSVVEGNVTINIEKGNVNLSVEGNVDAKITGNMSSKVSGDINMNADGKCDINSEGDMSLTSGGKVTVRGTQIRLN